MFDETPEPRHALMQDPAFASALRLCGQEPVRLHCGLTVLQRRFAGMRVCMLPRAVPPDDLPQQLRARGLHRAPMLLSPDRAAPLPRARQLRGHRTLAVLGIAGAKAECLKRQHPKWRNQLRRAQTENLRVFHEHLPADPDCDVLRIATKQARSRGYASWPAPLLAAFAAVAPQQTHLFRAMRGNTEVAHILFLSHGRDATYQLAFSTAEGKAACANNLLMWRASRYLADEGIERIDLGVVDGQTPGLDRFKLRTGAAPIKTGGTHLYWRPFDRA